MITFENSIVINKPVEEVFRFVADFENIPKWNYYVREVTKLSAGPVGKGARFNQIRKTDEQIYMVTEYVPYRKTSVKTEPDSWPKFEIEYQFETLPDATRLTNSWQLEFRHGYKLIANLATRRIKWAVAENLNKLKELLETGQTQLQDGRTVRLNLKSLMPDRQ
jgi:hypothetical protein